MAVNKVRQALGDSRTRPRYIETIPKIGYRFIHPLEGEPLGSAAPKQDLGGFRGRSAGIAWAIAASALVIAAVAVWLSLQPSGAKPGTPVELKPVPLTTQDGREALPTFSPDGSQVAFAAREGSGGFSLYVKAIGSEEIREITDHAGSAAHPAWAPDGSAIAYLLRTEDACELRLIPPLGGASQLVTPVTCSGSDNFLYTHLAWSNSSRHVVYRDKPRADEPWALFAIEIASKDVTRLTHPPKGIWSDDAPSFAWETGRLAFIRRYSAFNASEIRTLDLGPDMQPIGESKPVSIVQSGVRSGPARRATSVVWDQGDRDLLFLDADGLWQTPWKGGRAVRLLTGEGRLTGLALSRDGRRLAFSQSKGDIDIWRFDRADRSMKPLLRSTYFDWYQSFSPDGSRIAWTSRRSGFSEIWVCDADGSRVRQLTHLENHSGAPAWSPDSKTLAFDTRVDGNGDIYLIDADGGPPRRLTTHQAEELMPSWSADGATVYYESLRGGEAAIWSIDVNSGDARRISNTRGAWPIAGPDGRFLYFRGDYLEERGRLYRKRLKDGQETAILDDVASFAPGSGGSTSLRSAPARFGGSITNLEQRRMFSRPAPRSRTSRSRRTSGPFCSRSASRIEPTSCSWTAFASRSSVPATGRSSG